MLLNAGFLVGQNTLRSQVLGEREAAPTATEQKRLADLTRQALRDGAFGLSGNLGFPPGMFATKDEILALVHVVAEEGGLFTVHARSYTRVSDAYQRRLFGPPHTLRAVREMIGLARRTGVRLQYLHLMFAGRRSWGSHRVVLEAFDRSRAEGVDLSFDAFPYPLTNGPIQALFPAWFLHDFRQNLASSAAIRRLERGTLLTRVLLGMHPRDIRLMAVRDPALRELEGLDFATIGRRTDPLAYCASVGSLDSPDARYTGPQVPDAIAQGLKQAMQLPSSAPIEPLRRLTIWRCMDGKVYACNRGTNIPCEEKANTERIPSSEMKEFCTANQSAEFIPTAVTGRATVYQWSCMNGQPSIVKQLTQPDARGFISSFWYAIKK